MNGTHWLELLAYGSCLAVATPLLGGYLAKVFTAEKHCLSRWLGPVERGLYRVGGCDPKEEMPWTQYAAALLWFNLGGFLLLLGLLLTQGWLPLNPQHLPNLPLGLAFNTAISFVTNTNWQAYSGEATMSYLSQMLGLGVQNFLSAATGMAVLLALVRGLTRQSIATVGNFWADLVRTTVYVLLPLSCLLALVLVAQGVVQTYAPYVEVTTLEGATQTVPLGPAASQIAIKQLGTNGGGFFGLNSAHPFENPTPLTNFLTVLAILLLPSAQVWMFGRMVGARRQGGSILAAMTLILTVSLGLALWAEHQGSPLFPQTVLMEGKEQRVGVGNSILWSTVTTLASNGSVNAMHDSLTPLAGGMALFNMLLGEVVFGGVGAGLYGMLLLVILTVFLAGLMVGRSPEYLGKKIEAAEVKWAMLGVLAPCALVLLGTAVGVSTSAGTASISNAGPHGLSEVFYAFASAANNNGSAFGGLSANTGFYNYLLGFAMLLGRFAVIIPCLAIAGRLAGKKLCPASAGTFPTDGVLFVVLLVGVVLMVTALTFFPALLLGPGVEHLLLQAGRTF